jgi:beta-lactam-binding protein with PASTA domain
MSGVPVAAELPTPLCIVPDLSGRTLKAARRQLRRSHCKLGDVRGERSRGARVVRQFRKPGRELPAGTEVGVKLLVS